MLFILPWICLLIAIIGIVIQIHDMKKEKLAFKALERDAKNNQQI